MHGDFSSNLTLQNEGRVAKIEISSLKELSRVTFIELNQRFCWISDLSYIIHF
jgi:hypothetical protein